MLDNLRRAAADSAASTYEFGDDAGPSEMGGWEFTTPGDEWTRPIYLDPADEDSDTTIKAYFTVRFEAGTAKVIEAYAIDYNGNIFGHRFD